MGSHRFSLQREVRDDESIDGSTAELIRRVENQATNRQQRTCILFVLACLGLAVMVIVSLASTIVVPRMMSLMFVGGDGGKAIQKHKQVD